MTEMMIEGDSGGETRVARHSGTRVSTGLGSTSGSLTIGPNDNGGAEVTASHGQIHKHQTIDLWIAITKCAGRAFRAGSKCSVI